MIPPRTAFSHPYEYLHLSRYLATVCWATGSTSHWNDTCKLYQIRLSSFLLTDGSSNCNLLHFQRMGLSPLAAMLLSLFYAQTQISVQVPDYLHPIRLDGMKEYFVYLVCYHDVSAPIRHAFFYSSSFSNTRHKL